MDYTDDDVAYAEQLAASSSDPLDLPGCVDSRGFRQPKFGVYDLDEETEAEFRSLGRNDEQHKRREQGGERGRGGWGEHERFEDYGMNDDQRYSSPTPFTPQQSMPSSSRNARYFPASQHRHHLAFPASTSAAPIPPRPAAARATPSSNFIPLKPKPIRPVPAAPLRPNPPPKKSSGFPVPANGNTNRRRDEHLRPAGGASQFTPALGGHYASSSHAGTKRSGDREARGVQLATSNKKARQKERKDEEDEYFGGEADEAFESALLHEEALANEAIDQAMGEPSRAAPSQAQARPPPVAPQSRYRNAPQPIPATSNNTINGYVKLRPVSDLPDMFRGMWRFGVFNAIQSTCFETVYQSDTNVVVSAPTGSGKTVIFELAILRLFSTSDSNDTKAVYMAPTKALTSERAADWKRKFEQFGLGWTVAELTGDTALGPDVWKSIKRSRLIVTTPEKWDSITRSWHNHTQSFSQLALFCIDECHSVGMDVRGATLEVVVSRMKTLGTNTRFIAVSATVPNVNDVAEWLGSGYEEGSPATVFHFGEEYRPCRLHRIVLGYPPKDNDFSFSNNLNFKLYDLVKQYSMGKPVLIFCNTRKACSQAAEVLAKKYRQELETRPQSAPWPKPARLDLKWADKKLAALLDVGIAYHHAGLEQQDRKVVENLFASSAISVVCATSTLATGVNLPARMVIIKGTKAFRGARFEECTDMEILQMIGRAGRPQFDTSGVALIMTESPQKSRYEALVNSETMLESCLHKNLAENINSEINLRTITDIASALHWLRSTFLFVRIKKNPRFYAIANRAATSPNARLEEIVVESVKALVSEGIVDETEDMISPTTYGDMMARSYLSQATFVSIKNLPAKPSMRTLLETISGASEFSSTRFRQGDKGALGKVNKDLKFPVAKLATSADKVMILIQIILECIPGADVKTESCNPHTEAGALWQQITRMTRCILDVLLERRDGAIRTGLELMRSIHAKAWDGSPFILRQIEGVGEKSVKVLVDNEITTFTELSTSDASRLEMLLGRNPPFGRKLISTANAFPRFGISIKAEEEEVVDSGVKVTITVEVSVEKTSPSCIVKKSGNVYHAVVTLVTSDGQFIDFRRLRLEQLVSLGSKSYAVAVIVCRPSQRIIGAISCDHVAGSEVKASLKPSTSPSSFPLPSVGEQIKAEEEEEDEPLEVSIPSRVAPKPAPAVQQPADPEPKPPRRRPDGKWDCNHLCRDKTACKHLCCRDGTDNSPPVRRHKLKPATDTTFSSQTKLKLKPDALSQAKAKVLGPLTKTPSLKSDRLPSQSKSLNGSQTLKAFGGKTLAELLAEGGSDEDKAQDSVDEDLKSEEDLLSLDQLLKKNKQKKAARDARDAQLNVDTIAAPKSKSAFLPLGRKRKAPNSPIDLSDDDDELPAPLQLKPTDVLKLLESSEDEEEEDELAGDDALKQPYLVSALLKRVPAGRKPSRSASTNKPSTSTYSDNDTHDPLKFDFTSTRTPNTKSTESRLFSPANSDHSEAQATAVDDFQRPEEQIVMVEMEVDQPSVEEEVMEQSELIQEKPSYDDDSDMDEWLSSSVVIRAQ